VRVGEGGGLWIGDRGGGRMKIVGLHERWIMGGYRVVIEDCIMGGE
jgi:hypothetical protein